MSFRDNLQHLRATRNMTQEQLAMLVGVSRQSVTKWEAERSYPEMDKLLKICQIFDCTLDELVQGDLTARADEPEKALTLESAKEDTVGYVERVQEHALRMAQGVGCFVVGCGVGLLATAALSMLPDLSGIQIELAIPVCVLLFVVLGLSIVLPEVARHELFMKEHPYLINFFASEDRAANSEKSMREIVIGTATIILGVLIMVVGGYGNMAQNALASGIMMVLIASGVGFIVHGGIMSDMCDIEKYNFEAFCELTDAEANELLDSFDAEKRTYYLRKRHADRVVGGLCGATMLIATIVALLLLFAANSSLFWVAWPIGGITCGIIAIAGSWVEKR